MGYAVIIGQCYGCGHPFTFNPHKVPSVRDSKNEKQPVCRTCMNGINYKREKSGMKKFEIPADAYEPINENEM